jgi:hypothetical protein
MNDLEDLEARINAVAMQLATLHTKLSRVEDTIRDVQGDTRFTVNLLDLLYPTQELPEDGDSAENTDSGSTMTELDIMLENKYGN